jgi:putative flippase GtrA
MLTESSLSEKGKIIAKLIGKYASTSVIATTVDFSTFHLVLTYGDISAIQSTFIGRLTGAFIAFSLHRKWVFNTIVPPPQYKTIIMKYLSGIILGMWLNVTGVWVLNDFFRFDPWSARIIAAVSVWFLVFSYNKHVVFKEKIISEQDFAEEEESEEEIERVVPNN